MQRKLASFSAKRNRSRASPVINFSRLSDAGFPPRSDHARVLFDGVNDFFSETLNRYAPNVNAMSGIGYSEGDRMNVQSLPVVGGRRYMATATSRDAPLDCNASSRGCRSFARSITLLSDDHHRLHVVAPSGLDAAASADCRDESRLSERQVLCSYTLVT